MAESFPQVDSDLAPPTNPINNGKRGAEEVVELQVAGNKKHMKIEESIDCSSEELNKAELSPSPKLEATTQDAKKASSSDESMQEDEDEDDNTSKETPKKSVEVVATTQDEANEYDEEDQNDCSKEDHQHLETPKTSPLKFNSELLLDHPTTEHHDTGSKTLYLGNLSFLIEEDDVRDFFKNVGEIADIRFGIKDDRFLGYGHIEFTTAEAAQEALKLNKEVLLDRQVTIDITRRQRGAYTPGNSMDKSKQRGGHAQVKTVYIRGFESSDSFDNIRSALERHFGKCGDISRLDIPKDYLTGAPRGVAFIEFRDSNGFREAMGLNGSEVGGSRLIVEEAKKQRESGSYVREGGAGRGSYVRESASGRGSYVRESGSGSGWSGSNIRESGSGGGSNVRESESGDGWSGSHVRESGSGSGWSSSYVRESGPHGGWSGSNVRESGSGDGSNAREQGFGGGGWSGFHVRDSGPGSGWSSSNVRESGSRGGWSGSCVRESGPGGGWNGSNVRESGSGGGSYVRETGSGGGRGGSNVRESGSGGGSYVRENGFGGGSYVRESGSGGGRGGSYVRQSGSGGGWRRESGYSSSRLRVESGYGRVSHTENGSGSSWRGYGGGYDGGWGRGSGRFSSRGVGRGSSHRVGSFFGGHRRP